MREFFYCYFFKCILIDTLTAKNSGVLFWASYVRIESLIYTPKGNDAYRGSFHEGSPPGRGVGHRYSAHQKIREPVSRMYETNSLPVWGSWNSQTCVEDLFSWTAQVAFAPFHPHENTRVTRVGTLRIRMYNSRNLHSPKKAFVANSSADN